MNKSISSSLTLVAITTLSLTSQAWAKPEYVVPTGASSCDQCHLDNFGKFYETTSIA